MLWAAIVGGYFNFVTRVAYLVLGSYQGFALDKSMIKKLYFTQDRDAETTTPDGENPFTKDQRDLMAQIERVTGWSAEFTEWMFEKYRKSW